MLTEKHTLVVQMNMNARLNIYIFKKGDKHVKLCIIKMRLQMSRVVRKPMFWFPTWSAKQNCTATEDG